MLLHGISENIQIISLRFLAMWKGKRDLFFFFTIIAVAAYGFELFNFNLTIDEELYATGAGINIPANWIREGRWGMYLLQIFLLQNPVLPFVPLGIALFFHILSIFLLLQVWEIKSLWWQMLAGSLILTYPGWVYVYVFSTLSHGIGIGLFMISISLWVYANIDNIQYKWLAFIPATLAFSLYQAMLPILITVFLVFFVLKMRRKSMITFSHFFQFLLIVVLAVLFYYIVQQAFVKILNVQLTGYVDRHFLPMSDIFNLELNLTASLESLLEVYRGDIAIYALNVFALPLLIAALLMTAVFKSQESLRYRLFEFALIIGILILPLIPMLFMKVIKLRFLMGLSFSIAALLIIGVENCKIRAYHWLVSFFAVLTILQFITSTNQLFGATHITLQSDRVLAGQIIERIEMARSRSPQPEQVKYIEVIGYFQKVPTLINPRPYSYEIVGKSFFEFYGGATRRIVAFLKIINYDKLHPLPLERRAEFVLIAETMPAWPRMGSVQAVNDTVLVKFDSYSEVQINQICSSGVNISVENFCP